MAKSLISNFTFDASEKQITIDRNVHASKVLLITNTTDGIIIYSFADSTKGITATSHNASTNQTTFTLAHDTTSMSDTDSLQIFVEADETTVFPDETIIDPVSKFRICEPNTLIDTDFEYGPQATKWETVELVENLPSFFVKTDSFIEDVVSIETASESNTVTVQTTDPHGLQPGSPIDIR